MPKLRAVISNFWSLSFCISCSLAAFVKRSRRDERAVKKYLDFLEEAFVAGHAKRFDVKGKRYINTPLRHCFEDVGSGNAYLNFRQQEEAHIMENILLNEL